VLKFSSLIFIFKDFCLHSTPLRACFLFAAIV
jgi:hypothetical protein